MERLERPWLYNLLQVPSEGFLYCNEMPLRIAAIYYYMLSQTIKQLERL
jgi:hypothetical protein